MITLTIINSNFYMITKTIVIFTLLCAVGTTSFGMDTIDPNDSENPTVLQAFFEDVPEGQALDGPQIERLPPLALLSGAYSSSTFRSFSAEESHFSQMATIKTWVAPHYHSEQTLKRIQADVALTVRENPGSVCFNEAIQNDPGEKKCFGRSFPTISAIELPFLQWVREISKTDPYPVTMEVAASMGLVSWKVPFAFPEDGGYHYANELSRAMLRNHFSDTILTRFSHHPELREKIAQIPGSCFDIPKSYDELLGGINGFYAQNFGHCLNPQTHFQFMELVESLLAPGGRAFLCDNSFEFGTDPNHPLHVLYLQREQMGDLYPGFAEYNKTCSYIWKGSQVFEGPIEFSNASRPVDDAEFLPPNQLDLPTEHMLYGEEFLKVKKISKHLLMNAFSPSIYGGLVAKFPSLRVVDTFFIEKANTRVDQWGKDVTHAAVIIEKIDTEAENQIP